MNKIIITPIGGLANRMRAMAASLALAKSADYDCRIMWPVNRELYCPFGCLFDTVPQLPPVIDISSAEDFWIYGYPRKKNLFISGLFQARRYGLRIMPEVSGNPGISDPDSLVMSLSSAAGKDILIRTGLEFFPFTHDFYRSLFLPKKHILEEARRRVPDKNGYVGLHIRRTDNSRAIRYSPLELFIAKIEEHIAADPDVRFYLATDDETVKRELVGLYGKRMVFSPEEARRDTMEGIKEGLVEMMALSLCRIVYGSFWSSYSEAAAVMGDVPLIQLSCRDS